MGATIDDNIDCHRLMLFFPVFNQTNTAIPQDFLVQSMILFGGDPVKHLILPVTSSFIS